MSCLNQIVNQTYNYVKYKYCLILFIFHCICIKVITNNHVTANGSLPSVSTSGHIYILVHDDMKPYSKLVVYYFTVSGWNADSIHFVATTTSDTFRNQVCYYQTLKICIENMEYYKCETFLINIYIDQFYWSFFYFTKMDTTTLRCKFGI